MNLFENLQKMQENDDNTSLLNIVNKMSEKELRDYVFKHNLERDYNIMLNNKSNYSYSNQLRVLRDLVFDDMRFNNKNIYESKRDYRIPIKSLQNDKGDIINVYRDKETGRTRAEGDIPGASFNGPWTDEHEKYYKDKGFKEETEDVDISNERLDQEFYEFLKFKNAQYIIDNLNETEFGLEFDIYDGDWKHEHAYIKQLVREFFDNKGIHGAISSEVIDDTESDTFSAHYEVILEDELTEASYNEAHEIQKPEFINVIIEPSEKVSLSKFRQQLSSYPIYTYVRLCAKGSINAVSGYTYGKVKVANNKWQVYGALTGYADIFNTDQDILDLIDRKNIKNIGVKLPNNRNKKINEASYGRGFDIKDDKYFDNDYEPKESEYLDMGIDTRTGRKWGVPVDFEGEDDEWDVDNNCPVKSFYDDYTESNQNLNETSYGGAFDIRDTQYFTRDDLDEFANYVMEKVSYMFKFDEIPDLIDIYMDEDDQTLEMIIEVHDIEYTYTTNIDMRRIRLPKDLIDKYADEFIKYFYNEIEKDNYEREENNLK